MRRLSALLLLLMSVLAALPVSTAAQRPPCPHPRLRVGYIATVVEEGVYNNVRARPALGATVVTQLSPGSSVPVIGGPVCADSFNWYQVQVGDVVGWTADGDQDEPWLETTDSLNPSEPTPDAAPVYENALPVPPLLPPASSAPTLTPPAAAVDDSPLLRVSAFLRRTLTDNR